MLPTNSKFLMGVKLICIHNINDILKYQLQVTLCPVGNILQYLCTENSINCDNFFDFFMLGCPVRNKFWSHILTLLINSLHIS